MEPYFCKKCRVTHTKGKIYKYHLIYAQLKSYTKSQLDEIERLRSIGVYEGEFPKDDERVRNWNFKYLNKNIEKYFK